MRAISIALIALVCFTTRVTAQRNLFWETPQRKLSQGLELVDAKQYVSARQLFIQALQPENAGAYSASQLHDIQVLKTLCELEMRLSGADLQLINLLQTGNSTYNNRAYFALAGWYYDQKDFKNCLNVLQATDRDQLSKEDAISFNYWNGVSYYQNKNYKAAKPFFVEIKDIKSRYQSNVTFLLAYIYLAEKDYDKALEQYIKLEKEPAYSKEATIKICELYFAKKMYRDLVDFATVKLPNLNDNEAVEVNHLVGLSAYFLGDFYKCQTMLKKFSELGKPENVDYYYWGMAAIKQKDYTGALDPLRKVAVLKDSIGQNATYYLALCLIETNQKDQARTAFQTASKMDFDKVIKEEAAFQYAQLSYELGQMQGALPALQNFIKDYPKSKYNRKARELLSNMLLEANDFKAALEILEKIPEMDYVTKKTFQRAAYYRGVQLYNEDNYKEALNHFYKSQQYPLDRKLEALAHFWRAEALYKQGDYSGANFAHSKFLNTYTPDMNLPLESSPLVAYYTLGYSNYKMNKNSVALNNFERAASMYEQLGNSSTQTLGQSFAGDLYARLGDLYFLSNKYKDAERAYNTILKKSLPGAEYAALQVAILTGLNGDQASKLEMMKDILVKYPNSPYLDNVYLEIANLYAQKEDFSNALIQLEKMTKERSESQMLKTALVMKGLMLYNLDRSEEAIAAYKQVIESYPHTEEAEDAMEGLENIYTGMNQVDEYLKYVSAKGGNKPSESKQDSLVWNAAENSFNQKKDCKEAVANYTNYLNKFPSGIFSQKARFKRAECNNRLNNRTAALADYESIINEKRSTYSEVSYASAAQLAYQLKDYKKALGYYQELQKFAQSEANLLNSKAGEVKCLFELGSYGDCKKAAEKLLNSRAVPTEMLALGNLYLGKSELENGNTGTALLALEKVYNLVKDEKAAEAKYMIAVIQFRQGKYEKCQNTIFELSEKLPYFSVWVSKGFILMAESFAAQKNYFQAIATLEGLIENEDNAELKAEEQTKLEAYKKLENGN